MIYTTRPTKRASKIRFLLSGVHLTWKGLLPHHTRIGRLLCQSHSVHAGDWLSCFYPTPSDTTLQPQTWFLYFTSLARGRDAWSLLISRVWDWRGIGVIFYPPKSWAQSFSYYEPWLRNKNSSRRVLLLEGFSKTNSLCFPRTFFYTSLRKKFSHWEKLERYEVSDVNALRSPPSKVLLIVPSIYSDKDTWNSRSERQWTVVLTY